MKNSSRSSEKELKKILDEDDCRMRQLCREFNPVTGKGSVGRRFSLTLSDHIPTEIWLPVSMRDELPVTQLMKHGSLTAMALHELEEEGVQKDDEAIDLKMKDIWERLLYLRFLHDFPFWAATVATIKNKGGGPDVTLHLNRPQRHLVEHFEEQRLAGLPIRTILLKARQWGGSTCVQLYMAWLQMVHSEGLNSLIIAHQGAGSDEIKDMFDRMLDSYPRKFLAGFGAKEPTAMGKGSPGRSVGKSGLIMRVEERNCKIKIGSAERPDSCRGGDYNLVHLSEVGIWRTTDGKSPEDIVRSACGGVLLHPLTMIVYESTANGTGNFFHREYLAASRGKSQFRPLFIPWFEIEQYSLAMTEKERRIFASRLLSESRSLTSDERSEPGAYLWKLWKNGATLSAIRWYVEERRKYNDHARMAAEYPSDDIEAFAHSGALVFDRGDVEALRSTCESPGWIGEIESRVSDESVDDLYFNNSPGGGMEIWSMPPADDGECSEKIADRYVVAVDVGGRSAKADWSVITVIDRGPMADGGIPRIAAQWRGHCDWDLLAWRAARIAQFYQQALLIIESNSLESREPTRLVDGAELPFILCQIKDAYPNLYARRGGIENMRQGQELKLGFHTNAATKPMVIATLIRMIREGLYEEKSHAAIDEFLTYERRPNGSYGAIAGAHDDILMTRAIGLHVALHEMDPPHRISRTPQRRRGRCRPTEAVF